MKAKEMRAPGEAAPVVAVPVIAAGNATVVVTVPALGGVGTA